MSTSDTNSRKSIEQRYKRRKPAMRTWLVGWGSTVRKGPIFPNYKQPFALTEEQLGERRIHAVANELMESETHFL
jgi:hypothetical protein